jgi:hypothetical protein
MTEAQLRRICDDLHRDRAVLQEFNPALTLREAVFFVLYGSLSSLLDAPPDYQPQNIDAKAVYQSGAVSLLRAFAPELTNGPQIVGELAARLILHDEGKATGK